MPFTEINLLHKTARAISAMKPSDPKFLLDIRKAFQITKGQAGIWQGILNIDCENGNQPKDTFLQLDGWSKGVAFLNSHNLGRYWPIMGPQVTLYINDKLYIIGILYFC